MPAAEFKAMHLGSYVPEDFLRHEQSFAEDCPLTPLVDGVISMVRACNQPKQKQVESRDGCP